MDRSFMHDSVTAPTSNGNSGIASSRPQPALYATQMSIGAAKYLHGLTGLAYLVVEVHQFPILVLPLGTSPGHYVVYIPRCPG